MPTTLGTTFTHLGFTDHFTVLVVCPKCHSIWGKPVATPKSEEEVVCSHSDTMLYLGIPASYFKVEASAQPPLSKRIKPKVVIPFAPLKDLLAELLAHLGLEDQIEAWRSQPPSAGTYTVIWDGEIRKSIKGADEKHFFKDWEDDELRIAATCSLDWYALILSLTKKNWHLTYGFKVSSTQG
jgi:hypothetical protein